MMKDQDGWSVPASYGDPTDEYSVVRNGGAGLIDLSSRGRMLITGSESLQFLNGLITNDMKTLQPNQWMLAAFPNVQGRLLAIVRVIHRSFSREPGSDGFLIDTEAASHAHVLATVGRFTLAGDFHVQDLMDQTALLSLQGAKASEIVSSLFGAETIALEHHQVLQFLWRDVPVLVLRDSHTGEDGYDIFVSSNTAPALWEAAKLAGAVPIGAEAFDILRIEAGEPRYGIDMDETNVVTETGLDEAVSFTKGCYIGQEIIARIKYRGHVAKRLSGLLLAGKANVARGVVIGSVDGKEIGRVTSATFSPKLKQTIALGYLKYDYLTAGTEVQIDEMKAHVVELPFLRGSWRPTAETA